jgi:uncharacterized protein (TIGR02611 family)
MSREQKAADPDDPRERGDEADIAEIELQPNLVRRWHDHAAVVPFKAVVIFIGRNGRRIGVTVVGALLLLLGIAGLALPVLPGWLLIFAGLAVLSTEYIWAERMLKRAKRAAAAAKDKATRRSGSGIQAEPVEHVDHPDAARE